MKRKANELANEPQNTSLAGKSMRSKSDLPQSDAKGVLGRSCIFCSTVRKRLRSPGDVSFENLHKVETMECSDMLINAAKRNTGLRNSVRVLALGSEDLVAIEAHYHNSCRLKFLQEANNETEVGTSNRKRHEKAFEVFMMYTEHEIIQKRVPKYAAKLMELYKEQYKVMWETDENIDAYLAQNFLRKLNNKFGERLLIGKQSNKKGNFIYPQYMSFDEAKLRLNNLNAHEEQIRCAALVLRSKCLHQQQFIL